MIPLTLTAAAVALPGRIWLINVGGEGQLHIGALFAAWGALNFGNLPAWLLIPWISLLGFLGGGLWALISGFLRARGWVSETISTLLLNYVAILLLSFFIFGPWKDPESANYPQSAPFADAAVLPSFFGTRVHLGLLYPLVALILFHLMISRTRWGLEMRAIGANAEAARRNGIPIGRYIMVLMFLGGGLAGLAGMCEVSAIHGQLRPSLSPGYGYIGFLISWMAMGNAAGMAAAAFLLAIITAGGDILQMNLHIPGSVVNILMAIILFVILARKGGGK
jgi:simple sugar transport system permease protein